MGKDSGSQTIDLKLGRKNREGIGSIFAKEAERGTI